jgi:hypothetical protein
MRWHDPLGAGPREELIRKLRILGFQGPFTGGEAASKVSPAARVTAGHEEPGSPK